jgi:Zn-dependent protease
MDIIFQIIILIMSVVIHETSHGFAALRLGDYTAKVAGRLTLNPINHLDIFGSIVVPLITSIGGFTFGWAKPVPYNPHNLRWKKWGDAAVAAAGPFSNILMALIFGLVSRLGLYFEFNNPAFYKMCFFIVVINLVLFVFNMMPIPPLDGSKLILPFLSARARDTYFKMETYGFFVVLAFLLLFGDKIILPIVSFLSRLIIGI